jgi:prepilin-type N-terminal cleavage/methylation domain-containing protein
MLQIKRKAFTLIELLVVISMISVLISLLCLLFNRPENRPNALRISIILSRLDLGFTTLKMPTIVSHPLQRSRQPPFQLQFRPKIITFHPMDGVPAFTS